MFSVGLLAFALGAVGTTVQATSLTKTFDFNTLTASSNNASIQSYLQGLLPGWTVTVSGAVGERTYTGDDHVVGSTFSGSSHNNINGQSTTVWSNTLGTSDGATGPLNGQRNPGASGYNDTFITNNAFTKNGDAQSDQFSIRFIAPTGYGIDSISFDYEIFPNASCPGGSGTSNCSVTPDFTLKADGVQKLYTAASKPGTSANDSPLSTSETAWQFLGVSGLIAINDSNNDTTLDFIDWPAMIGIDNLVINYHDKPGGSTGVPEPSSMLLVGFGLLSLRSYLSRRRGQSEGIAQ